MRRTRWRGLCGVEASGAGLRRRMAELRRRRANAGEAEREGEGKRSWRAPSPRREASGRRNCRQGAVERRRGLELQAPTMAAARKLGFCEGGSDGCGFRVPGRRRCFYRGRRPLDVRATPRTRRHGVGSDSTESFLGMTRGRQRISTGRANTSVREEGRKARSGLGREGRRNEEKKKGRWAGLKTG